MHIQKVNFKNTEGQQLVGRLELPINQHPHNFVIFAHCFTCNKNLSAVKNITRELTANGFGVLRFDFTGLGESEGAFENTNFSGNVEDLISASNYLKENYTAPTLLIGHSLGGAAVIFAASKIKSVKAVATIGAPSTPKHVQHLIKSSVSEIKATGKANVNIGGRAFTIKKQFLDDIETKSLPDVAQNLRKALLVMHAPQDTTVGIENAEEIYVAARHPKSFVTLDGADHLLMKKEDSIYAGSVIATWAKRYITIPTIETVNTTHQAVASLDAQDGYTAQMTVGNHTMMADEPIAYGGNDFGPSPYEYVSAGLSACTAITVQMYVKRKDWDLQNIEVHTSHTKVVKPVIENGENKEIKVDTFIREIKLTGNLDEKQIQRILQIANKCPVHKTLHSAIEVITKLV
ncbi:bifunctional alpha/beta hydrolase/OsmC family protein [Lacinutrix sp. C3R15]|uniref:bifunctional alpha/beta hydrolase/OsmC family protein n=1 Tax=Flavobacteriaceae TaxID=49546 RepID=UPI001C0840B9|nr:MULTISPECIES: bifunctional alpha/beta hydrolase/OsmC family protein [Flavobacteriaceae]MBU2938922.1 bifunctional alpha/beta hydrolase/OsmC family protein [Lacinutrix sp. C3R15]MDO6622235.1 bifunctional alpha/beta hydrolase/OsmC family protein [Oceanihabitans sp. 1_MG-2023]